PPRRGWSPPAPCRRAVARSLGHVRGAGFANHGHADLSRVLEFGFDPPRDRLAQRLRADIVDLFGLDDHPHFPASLDHGGLLDAGMLAGYFFEPGQPLDVALERLAP